MSGMRKFWLEKSRLAVESLEARSLLSGLHAMVTPKVASHAPAVVSSAKPVSSAPAAKSPEAKSETHLSATLADPSGASAVTGSVKFESELKRGVAVNELNVQVKGATAGSVLTVTATDSAGVTTTLGQITVKANGTGQLKLSSKAPDLVAGTVISVSATDTAGVTTVLASGTLATPVKTPGGSPGSHSETHLKASLVDPASTLTGKASYESETERGLVVTEFCVELKGGTPGAVIDVSLSVDGTSAATSIGRITIGADGKGKLKLTSTAPAVTTSSVITLSTVTTADGTETLTPITSATFAAAPHS